MMNARLDLRSASSDESGLTLVEVLAAVIVVVIVALASAGLSINGIQTAAAQERQQVAVTIANGSMETVSGWSVAKNSTTTVSNLLTGRYTPTVATAYANWVAQPGVTSMYPGVDPTALSTSTPAIPITTTTTQNGTVYTVATLIGYCYEPLTGGTCSTVSGQSILPIIPVAGYTQLLRAVVLVKWTAGSTCAASGCFYTTTTLIDPHSDLQWVTH